MCFSGYRFTRRNRLTGAPDQQLECGSRNLIRLTAEDLDRLRQRVAAESERAMIEDPREIRWHMGEPEWGHKPQVVTEQVEVRALQPGQLEKSSEQPSLSFYQPCALPPARVQRGTFQ